MPRVDRTSDLPEGQEPDGEDLTIDFDSVKAFSADHIRQCRAMFPTADLGQFKLMMKRAKALGVDPLTDVWLSETGSFGLRSHAMFTYAMSTGKYAPSGKRAEVEQAESLINEANPEGFGRITVWIKYKTDDGQWHDVPGEAYWGDLVPLKNATRDAMGRRTGGILDPDSFWASMPFLMLRKNAFSDALRRAFPILATFRTEGERSTDEDVTGQPVAQIPAPKTERTLEINWNDGLDAQPVPISEFGEIVGQALHVMVRDDPQTVMDWFNANEHVYKDFYHYDKRTGYKNVKAIMDAKAMAKSVLNLSPATPPTRVRRTQPA